MRNSATHGTHSMPISYSKTLHNTVTEWYVGIHIKDSGYCTHRNKDPSSTPRDSSFLAWFSWFLLSHHRARFLHAVTIRFNRHSWVWASALGKIFRHSTLLFVHSAAPRTQKRVSSPKYPPSVQKKCPNRTRYDITILHSKFSNAGREKFSLTAFENVVVYV